MRRRLGRRSWLWAYLCCLGDALAEDLDLDVAEGGVQSDGHCGSLVERVVLLYCHVIFLCLSRWFGSRCRRTNWGLNLEPRILELYCILCTVL